MKAIFRCALRHAVRGLLWLGLTCMGLAGYAQDRVALIIGVSEYAPEVRANSLGGVKYDMDSAQKIAAAMGVTADKIIFLRDAQATKPAIMQRLEQLGQNTPDGGRALVYFSGHGTRYFDREAGGCVEGLLTYEGETITHNEFAVATRKLSQRADKVIALMDACHSGGVVEQVQRTRSVLGGDRLVRVHQPQGGELQPAALEALQDLEGEPALHGVRLDEDQRAFQGCSRRLRHRAGPCGVGWCEAKPRVASPS